LKQAYDYWQDQPDYYISIVIRPSFQPQGQRQGGEQRL